MSDQTVRRGRIAGAAIGVVFALAVSVTYWIYPHWWIAIPYVVLGIIATRLARRLWIEESDPGSD